jgi:hypothetical protein
VSLVVVVAVLLVVVPQVELFTIPPITLPPLYPIVPPPIGYLPYFVLGKGAFIWASKLFTCSFFLPEKSGVINGRFHQ